MPTVRYRIRNEYGLADPEVYRAADKDDPEALLEGVAMAGLVGLLRQLGDLAEFAAEVFHDLHEEVMATSARGHGLMLRVQQLEAEFPSIEKALLSQTDHASCAYSEGIDWHANIRVDQNLVTQGDMPRFILDSYEECRGPPRLFMLDKFDVAGAGACLTRYSDPSFFKTASASSKIMETELQREKRTRKLKKKGSDRRSGEMADSFFTPIIEISHHIASEPAPEKFLARPVRLKHRNLRSLYIGSRKSYMECLLKEELLVQNDLKTSLSGSHIKTSTDWNSEVEEVLFSSATDSSLGRKEVYHMSPKEEVAAETISMLSGASQKLYQNSQNAKQKAMLVGLGNRMGNHAFDLRSDENDSMLPALQLTEKNNLLVDSGLITDDDHGGYGSDDIESELENYVDALNTMESEIETDSGRRTKSDAGLFNSESRGTNPGFNGHLELQPEFPGSGLVESFDKSKYTEKMEDGTPVLSQSTNLVFLHPQLQKRAVDKATSCLEIDQVETGGQERTGQALELIPSANSTFNGTCYEKQSNANRFAPINEGASSNPFTTDSALNPKWNSEEAQSLSVPSAEAFFANTESTPDVSHHIESSFLPWKTNHVVSPTYNEPHDIPSDIIEEINPREHCEDRISATLTDKDNMSCDISEAEHGILPEKDPAEFLKGSPLTTVCDEIGKPLVVLVNDTNDCISESISPMIPIGGTFVQESPYLSNELEIDMQSEDLPKKTCSEYIDGSDEPCKQLDPSLQFPAETHGLPLIASNDTVSHESTQNSENVYYDLEHLSDERGAPSRSRDYLMKDQFSGDTEKNMVNDMASLFQMSKLPQKPPESSFQEVSTIYVKDSLHNSMMKNNETYSVEKLSPSSSAFSLEIVSSIPQSESLDVGTRNISTTEELVPPQSPSCSGNVDIIEHKASIFTYIPNQLEHFSDAEEPQQVANIGTGEPPPSDCGEDPGVNPLQTVLSELVETNGKEHFTYALEVANGSTNLSLLCDQLQLEESAKGDHSLAGSVITEDCMYVQGLHMLQSAKVPSFDVHLQEDPLPGKDTYKPKPSIEEPAITRDLTSLQPENKSVMPFAQKDLEILFSTVSINHSSGLDLSDPSDAKLVGLKVDLCAELPPNLEGDKISSRENEHDSDLKSENFTTEDVISLLQSSNVFSLDVPLQKGAVSEDAVLNQCMLDVEELDTADSVSKSGNVITEVCAVGQVLSLLQSPYLSSVDAMFQEDPVSEDASLNQLMPEIEEPVVKSELASLKFASNLFAPLTKNGDQEESVRAVSSSQFLALDSSNFTDDKLADDTFGDIHIELDHVIYKENFICSREDEQGAHSKASVLHFQAESPVAEAERSEVQSEQTSVTEAVDEPSKIHLYGGWVNIKPSDTHFYEVCSDERTNILNNLELEVLLPGPEYETLLNHGRNNELSMPSSKTDEWEEIKTDPTFVSPCDFEHTGSSTALKTSASESPFVADFIIPASVTSIEESFQALPGEVISGSQLQKDVVEAPPLPPLPPLQWRTAKPQLGSLTTGEHMISVMETNPITLPSNAGSLHVNFLPPSNEEIDQHTLPTPSPSALEKRFQHSSSITDGHMTESLECSELPPITMDYWQELEIQFPNFKTFQSSDHSLIVPSKDGNHAHGNIATEADNPFTTGPSLKNVNLQHPDLFEEGKPQDIEEKRPKLVKLLPGLELERSQEASVMDGDATLALGSFLFMPTAGDGKYQYAYGDYGGETMHHHNLSAPFPVAFRNVPHYGYHMFLREGNSSIYDIMLPEMEGDQPYGKPRSIRNRPRDPLIEAVAAHDKSKLRKVSELDPPLTKPAEDERNYLLEQIKNKSFNLKPAAAAKPNLAKAPSTNLKVAAILEKANAIRQACVGSDEDEDDNWSDS